MLLIGVDLGIVQLELRRKAALILVSCFTLYLVVRQSIRRASHRLQSWTPTPSALVPYHPSSLQQQYFYVQIFAVKASNSYSVLLQVRLNGQLRQIR
jgi:hypothetical protein